MSHDFGFDPADLFRRRPPGGGRPRPRIVRSGPLFPRRRRIILAVVAALVIVAIVFASLIGLRVQWLFLDNLGHSNVFWTPLVTQVVLFIVGFVLTGGLVAVSIIGWVAAARSLDRLGGRVAFWSGLALAIIAGIGGGAFLAGQWQDVLLFLHQHSFGHQDPVFHQDASFFIFALPVYDDLQALAWTGVVLGLLGAIAVGALCLFVELVPEEVPIPLRPPAGRTPRDGLRIATVHAGIALTGVFVMAALGAHFGAYHLATSQHDQFVGLDATQRNVSLPVLHTLRWVALAFAVATVVLLVLRRRSSPLRTAIVFGSMLAGWLVIAGLLQGVPAAVYQATSVNPNALTAQRTPIADYLDMSRYAWALQSGTDVEVRKFGSPPGSSPTTPTVADLTTDLGTLQNVRIQDYRLLPETFQQIDRSRSYQTYPSITVDRYPAPGGGETQVMLAPREVAEADIPGQSFVNKSFIYTHGYGITVASVNHVGNEGKPDLLAGHQPLQLIAPDAPPDLLVKDPRIYCGLATTQPVVVNTNQPEFDYPSGSGDQTSRFGNVDSGLPVPGALDRLAVSLGAFHGLDLFLTSSTTPDSRILLHRDIRDRIAQLAPFLRLDGDPYIVADQDTGHLMVIADAYVATDRMPESFQLGDGTSYMRNAVKVVMDARTCQTTLYAVDLNEPMTATWNDIYPGLMVPLDRMPTYLRAHLRYPEDLFTAQAQVYAAAHITNPSVLFNRSDLWRIAEELIGASQSQSQQTTQAYYVELNLPGSSQPQFVLLQTFSPAQSAGGGGASNVMTAWLAATCDYTTTNHPKLVAVPLNNADNVLGPLQFDNNLNTNKDISSEISLLNQSGSQVVLGNVIVLPFNQRSFLYVRPMYVQAANGSFPQLREVLVGTQDSVAKGPTFADALQSLFGVTSIPGLQGTATPGATPSPGASPSPAPSASPSPGTVSPEVVALVQDLLLHEQRAQAALKQGDFTTFGKEEDLVQQDVTKLRTLLGPGVSVTPAPTATPTP